MTFKAILFDVDGTLVDSNEQHISAWADAFQQFGYDLDRQSIHDQMGKGGDNLVPALLPDISHEELEKLGNAQGELFQGRYRGEVRPFPGAKDLIGRVVDDGNKVVLASSASSEELEFWIELLDVRHLLTATTSRSDVAHSKPAPDIFRAALDKVTPIQPSEAVVIGDTPYDLQAARKCAIPSIGLRSGKFSDEAMTPFTPLKIYDDVAGILADYDGSPLRGRIPASMTTP
jgi:membrane protein